MTSLFNIRVYISVLCTAQFLLYLLGEAAIRDDPLWDVTSREAKIQRRLRDVYDTIEPSYRMIVLLIRTIPGI